jgi:hypothetical protein
MYLKEKAILGVFILSKGSFGKVLVVLPTALESHWIHHHRWPTANIVLTANVPYRAPRRTCTRADTKHAHC